MSREKKYTSSAISKEYLRVKLLGTIKQLNSAKDKIQNLTRVIDGLNLSSSKLQYEVKELNLKIARRDRKIKKMKTVDDHGLTLKELEIADRYEGFLGE